MLRILGTTKTLCDGIRRRDLLIAGGLNLLGQALGGLTARPAPAVAAPARAAKGSFGRAKSCILLYLYGAPSQLELCDLKPEAPAEIRGEFKPIRSRLPGCDVCEWLPRTAQVMDRVAVVRSLTHPYPTHAVHYTLTGNPNVTLPLILEPASPRHWPFLGSVVDLLNRSPKGRPADMPGNIGLPVAFGSQHPGQKIAGFRAGFLGSAHAPVWTRFHGEASQRVKRSGLAEIPAYQGPAPYLGIKPDSRFELADGASLSESVTLDRLNQRRSLLEQFDRSITGVNGGAAAHAYEKHREKAFALLDSRKVRTALDLNREPAPLREAYGMNLFGQSTLLARRLVEAGSRFVTVVWDEVGAVASGWDTHLDHFPRMKNALLPGFDRAFSSLIQDLEARGILDDTLVLCLSEHGRAPKVDNIKGGGRNHWSRAYTNLFAGGGIARGRVIGKTDRHAAQVVERPLSPKDVLASVYHLLGIDADTTLTDRSGQPLPLVANGEVIQELLA
ncbi:hypothetical protein AYO40_01665 [Planctomycetaceae bacterium SCGC AG-212-D15]|nr:hypothetical protein AYO40_01665 [Planctomycetaceae bacterium SCGC AG-212-D15]